MNTQEEMNSFELPDWAERKVYGEYKAIRCALPTRDGRITGNAVNAGTYKNATDDFPTVYTVITDAGNIMRCTETELMEMFYPPKWAMTYFLPSHIKAMQEDM